MARITPCLENGKTAFVKGFAENEVVFGSTEYIVMRAIPGHSDPAFIYYLATSPSFREVAIKSMVGSSGRQRVQQDVLENLELVLPDYETQVRVGKVLSAFDDKIELNTQINHNLEEQAKAIFKSWFVDFEPFAGKEPDGLKVVDLLSICELVTKGTTPTTLGFAFTPGGINFIKAESISDTHSFDIDKFSYIDQQTNNALKRSIIQDGDILFTIAGTLGRFAIADKSILPANTNQAVAIIRPKPTEVHPYYIYSFLLGGWHTEYYRKRVQQAVQANLSLTTIKSLSILLLPEPLKQRYENIIVPLFTTILQNTLENRTLCKLRDALLPKLMSGEIDVSEVEV
jgi:type I restriction enzyme S subunit